MAFQGLFYKILYSVHSTQSTSSLAMQLTTVILDENSIHLCYYAIHLVNYTSLCINKPLGT